MYHYKLSLHLLGAALLLICIPAISVAQTIYWKKDFIKDPGGGMIAVATPQPNDTTAPSQPSGLNASGITSSALTLSWTGSTDNVAVAGYLIYRDAVPVAAISGLV